MKKLMVFLGLTVIVLLCGAEASPLASLTKADVPPPRTSAGLNEIVEDLTADTPWLINA